MLARRLLIAAGSGSFSEDDMTLLGWVNVKSYGATGNGTDDDTDALNAAIAQLNALGTGVLYFPAGTYKITSDLTTITASGTLLGSGNTGFNGGPSAGAAGYGNSVTTIRYDSQTGTALTIDASDFLIAHIAIRNRSGTTPTAGAGVAHVWAARGATYTAGRCDFEDVSVDGFYDDVDQQGGTFWSMRFCQIMNAVRYGIRVRNIANGDWGMWAITNVFFTTQGPSYTTDAGLRLESSGGGKIIGCNWVGGGAGGASQGIDRCLDIVGGGGTSSLVVSNCQMENWGINAVRCVGSWPFQAYMNIEIAQYSPNTTGCAFDMSDTTGLVITDCIFNTNVSGPAPAAAIVFDTVTNYVVANNVNSGYTAIGP